MSDDWNISHSWVEEMRERSWWRRRAIGCIASYWIYQHIGNLSPRGARRGRDLQRRCAATSAPTRCCSTGPSRSNRPAPGCAGASAATSAGRGPIFVDSRAGRVLDRRRPADGRRRGVGVDRRPDRGRLRPPADRDHGALAPLPRPRPARGLERAGLRRGARQGSRRAPPRSCAAAVDFDHWGSFGRRASAPCATCSAKSPPGERGGQARPRSSSSAGDVHHAYLCEVGWPPGEADGKAPIYQAVCSPVPQPALEAKSSG